MVVASFLKMRVTPLQEHSHFVCEYAGDDDPTRLFPRSTHTPSDKEVGQQLRLLCAPNDEWRLPRGVHPLWRFPQLRA